MPSIALTQLKSAVESKCGQRVSVDVLYLNLEFGKYFGLELYEFITNSLESHNTGLGEWFFRQAAFPELPDNSEEYFKRYFPRKTNEFLKLKASLLEKRSGLERFMDELIDNFKMGDANLVGFTSMFMQNVANFGLARELKQRNPSLITVMGGANCEYPMGRVIAERATHIDYVFSGPALKNFPQFVEHQIDGDLLKCDEIRGVMSRRNLPASGPVVGEELSIDTPVPLDYDLFLDTLDTAFPDRQVKPVLPFETSRGCWWGERAHCTFCGLNGESMAYRAMKPEGAIQQFNSLFRYSGRVARLEAVDNILPKQYLSQVLPALKTPPGMAIFYEVKADLSESDLAVLADSGVKFVQPGIESLATSTLKLMKKGTTAFQNLRLLKLCSTYGIHPLWNLLVGFPGEGEDVYRRYVDLLPLIVHLQPPTGVYPVRFDRFSPYYNQRQSYGLDLSPLDFYSFVYPFNEQDRNEFAYYFSDRNIGAGYFIAMARWIGKLRAGVADWVARWDKSKAEPSGLPPRLYFQEDSNVVFDSRSGVAVEHLVGKHGKRLLEFLSSPTRLDDVIKRFAESDMDVEQEVGWLTRQGLLFQESDRLLSLVLEPKRTRTQEKYLTIAPTVKQAPAQPFLVLA
jgi:magnesium-protoporphyrin IX monomethyl ester (oxidative) cyclase